MWHELGLLAIVLGIVATLFAAVTWLVSVLARDVFGVIDEERD